MLSFDSESSLCGHKLTTPMQAQVTRYMKQVVTEDETESDEEQELMHRWNNLKGTG
jgi:hypothetical protein